MSDETRRRIEALARDRNVDVEDLQHALAAAQADGQITPEEELALLARIEDFEPAARRFLEDALSGRAGVAAGRVLLAQAPPGAQRDLYYPRADVMALQDALTRAGFPAQVDGHYGPATARSVGDLQASAGLPRTGALDSAALLALNERLAARGEPPLDVTPRARVRPDAVVALRGAGAPEVNRALQAGLARLAERVDLPELRIEATGAFDGATERAVAALQRLAYLPETGIVDAATLRALDAALEHERLAPVGLDPAAAPGGPPAGVELHFYPGPQELKVYALRGAEVLGAYAMVGGRIEPRDDPNNASVRYDPTPAGQYVVDLVSPHASSVWAYSYVPYGAALREADGEVLFRDLNGRWRWATGPKGVFAGREPPPLEREDYLDADGKLPPAWTRSDFGHLRARLRRISDGAVQTHMIHPVPAQEGTERYFQDTAALLDPRAAQRELGYSHGCEHIHPKDLDEMISRGYLAPGTRFIVHGYDEVFAPPAAPPPSQAGPASPGVT